MAQLWYSPISINAAQVPSMQTDFPVLVSVTDARFKDVAHSGHVNRSDGFDLRPYTDTTLGTAITGYYLHRYTPTTGEVIMRVKVSSLSSSTTPIVLGYGDTGITTDGSSTTCFSNSYLGFYPLGDGTTLNVNSTTGSNNGTNNSATANTGQVNGGAGFVAASSQYIDLGNGIAPTSITLSSWIKAASFPGSYNSVIARSGSGSNLAAIYCRSTGRLAMYCTATGPTSIAYDPGSNTLSAGTWYYVTLTYTGTANAGIKGYINAATADGGVNSTLNLIGTTANTNIGRDPNTSGSFFNGSIDEARIASVARSPDWITTEYNNEFAPGTFETLGTEVAFVAPTSSNMFLLFP